MKKNWILAGLVVVLSVSTVFGSLVIDLKAIDGAGYVVKDAGKTVQLSPTATSVTMQVWGTYTSEANQANSKISIIAGNIVSARVGSGAVTGGTLGLVQDTDFDDPGQTPGNTQILTPDGIRDIGVAGTAGATNGTLTWNKGSNPEGDFIKFVQASAGTAMGNQLLGTLTLSISSLNATATANDKTEVQWYFRSDSPTIKQSFTQSGAGVSEAFGTNLLGGTAVSILVPEPVSIVLLAIGGLGLLRRKS